MATKLKTAPPDLATLAQPDVAPLSALHAGEIGIVVELLGGNGLLGRMTSLGFTPGADITVLQNFGRGPIIARVREARIALGRGEAEQIYVHRQETE